MSFFCSDLLNQFTIFSSNGAEYYLVLSKLILPKISDNLESRKSQILENIETTETQREESEKKRRRNKLATASFLLGHNGCDNLLRTIAPRRRNGVVGEIFEYGHRDGHVREKVQAEKRRIQSP